MSDPKREWMKLLPKKPDQRKVKQALVKAKVPFSIQARWLTERGHEVQNPSHAVVMLTNYVYEDLPSLIAGFVEQQETEQAAGAAGQTENTEVSAPTQPKMPEPQIPEPVIPPAPEPTPPPTGAPAPAASAPAPAAPAAGPNPLVGGLAETPDQPESQSRTMQAQAEGGNSDFQALTVTEDAGDLFLDLFTGAQLTERKTPGIIRVECIKSADPTELRQVQVELINQMRVERQRKAVPDDNTGWQKRNYKLSKAQKEGLQKIGKDERLGRLGQLRLMRAALATLVACVDQKLPIYREEEVLESEILLGISRGSHKGHSGVPIDLPDEVAQAIDRIATTTLLNQSDLAVMAVDQLLVFVNGAQDRAGESS